VYVMSCEDVVFLACIHSTAGVAVSCRQHRVYSFYFVFQLKQSVLFWI